MKRRRQLPRSPNFSRLVVPLGLGLALLACALGFVHFTQITLDKQAHFAPGSEHPDDGYAVGCLFLGMTALAGLLLNLRDPPPSVAWRRIRRIAGSRRVTRRAKPARRRVH